MGACGGRIVGAREPAAVLPPRLAGGGDHRVRNARARRGRGAGTARYGAGSPRKSGRWWQHAHAWRQHAHAWRQRAIWGCLSGRGSRCARGASVARCHERTRHRQEGEESPRCPRRTRRSERFARPLGLCGRWLTSAAHERGECWLGQPSAERRLTSRGPSGGPLSSLRRCTPAWGVPAGRGLATRPVGFEGRAECQGRRWCTAILDCDGGGGGSSRGGEGLCGGRAASPPFPLCTRSRHACCRVRPLYRWSVDHSRMPR